MKKKLLLNDKNVSWVINGKKVKGLVSGKRILITKGQKKK